MATKKNSFNIPALYKQAFGITGVRFAIPKASSLANTAAKTLEFAAGLAANESLHVGKQGLSKYAGIQTIPLPTAASIQSVMGTPIYEQITLTVPSKVSNGVVTSQGFSYTFPDWPMFDINPAWLLEKENVQGGGTNGTIGTVKEFIQQDDFQITIRGFLINYATQDYPSDLLSDLWKVLNCGQAIGVTSPVFNLLDIHNIVVTAARFPGVEGYMNMQPFEIDCLSDYQPILQIKSAKTQKAIVPGL